MIGIIDYGMGNLGSVSNACRFLQCPARLVAEPGSLRDCRAIILPGVGAFGDCMDHLVRHGLTEPVKAWLAEGRPFLGICLGLHMLFEGSDEAPGVPGLGVLPGRIQKFAPGPGHKVPQIGWNCVRQARRNCPLFEGIPDQAFFYFVHSYYAAPRDSTPCAGMTEYGLEYPSVVWKANMLAVQFHPEKSQQLGLRMLKNFAAWSGVVAA